MSENVEISLEEYEKLKQIEKDTEISRTKLHCVYDKLDIPIKVLDFVIVGGILFIIAAVLYGIYN